MLNVVKLCPPLFAKVYISTALYKELIIFLCAEASADKRVFNLSFFLIRGTVNRINIRECFIFCHYNYQVTELGQF